jgi:PKD repeat protein
MKKLTLTLAGVLLAIVVCSQQVPRQMVLLEIGTGTWCGFCPGAAMGADDLLTNGHNVAVIKYHSGDPFASTYSSARIGYYAMTGYPTSKVDGILSHVGGSATVSLYPTYLPMVTQRNNVLSSYFLDITGTSTGNNYNIQLNLDKVAAHSATNIVAHLVLTESYIPHPWQNQSHVKQATRLMAPDASGTALDFSNTSSITLNLNFTVDPTWIYDLELVAFIQDNTTKEVLQATKVALLDLPPPFYVNFTANQTEFCPVQQVEFTDSSDEATFWQWTFPGGNPATSNLQNPVVSYSAPGVYDVTLTAGDDEVSNTTVKSNYINVLPTPASPNIPNGPSTLCVNPAPTTYTTIALHNATAYEWVLVPASAGTLTPDGVSCVVDWTPDYTGSAQLRVRGINDCGDGAWSQNRNIAISLQPGQPGLPTGSDGLCKNPGTTEYSTTGTINVTDYIWTLTPSNAGTVNPVWTTCFIAWNPDFAGTATLMVHADNEGCAGEPSELLTITINDLPTAFAVSGGGILCDGQAGLDIGLAGSQTGTDYTFYLDGTTTGQTLAGTGAALSFGLQTVEGSYTVMAVNTAASCENTMSGSADISISYVPGIASLPDGPTSVFSPATPSSEYTTSGAQHANGYEWAFDPATAGTMDVNGPAMTVTWDETFQGEVLISVRGVNLCGEGEFSESLLVIVDNEVSIHAPGLNQLISVFPNPASDFILVSNNSGSTARLTITGITGKLLHESLLSSKPNQRISLDNLSAGIYLLTITTNEETQTQKLIIQ